MAKNPKSTFWSRRILIAEDSSITQDLLKLLLSQRGHSVDIVGDGETALSKLCGAPYDVALLDFHLPRLNGLGIVTGFREQEAGQRPPFFVAMTADIEGLMSDGNNCELFDKVIPKPLDIHAVIDLIEKDRQPESAIGESKENKPAPAAPETPRSINAASLPAHQFLIWPNDFRIKKFARRDFVSEVKEGRLEAILLKAPAGEEFFGAFWRTNPLHLLPIVDHSGAAHAFSDIDASRLSGDDARLVTDVIGKFQKRRDDLHPDFLTSTEFEEKLIAHMALKDETLEPALAPASRGFIAYNAPIDEETLVRHANKASAAGFVEASFFDRFHACPNCRSSRLNIREECSECGGAHLSEEAYIHHFTCAYQGREQDFQGDDGLKCPKCRKSLTHFSIDYDKPGYLTCCASCGQAASETNVAFVCIDCGLRTSADAMPTRDVFSFALTDRGRQFLDVGRVYLGQTHRSLPLADLPLDLVISLNREARRFNEDKTPFVLLNVGYHNARAIERQHGVRQFSEARNLFLENFGNALDGDAIVVKGHAHDFALIKGEERADWEPRLGPLCERAAHALRFDLGVAVTAFGPSDFQ